ncbi:MAG TPA: hypothetical protein DDX92_09215 [Flavobacteriales bacterium]|jgi:competence protein ComEC|nr:hypothetical protein [Flavobacteriales bacterium]
MRRLLAYPMVLSVVPLSLGIMAALSFGLVIENSQSWTIGLIASLLIILVFFNRWYSTTSFKAILQLVLVFILFASIGFYNGNSLKKGKPLVSMKPNIRMGRVITKPKNIGPRTLLTLEILDSNGQHMNIQLWLDTSRNDISVGDQLISSYALTPTKKPKNPYSLDFSSILERRGIFYQGYVPGRDSILVISSNKWSILKWAQSVQDRLLNVFKEAGFKDENLALVSALTLGYKSDMQTDQKEAFSKAGVIHVLAVSGLHVGIVLLLLRLTFFWMNKSKGLRTLRSVLILLGIWVFAFITGLSPSVTRASMMFSLFVPFNSAKYRGNSYNTLATSAFILLMIQPNLVLNLGFQLSYAAVLGILIFYNPIYKMLSSRFYAIRKIWSLTAVSIAAQIGTLPLILYYFDQIPTYGLLANLAIVPLVFPFIMLGGLYLLFHAVPFVGDGIAWCLNLLADVMNFLAVNISNWPGSTVSNFAFSWLDAMMLTTILAGIAFILAARKKYRPLLITAILITLFSTLRMTEAIYQFHEKSVGIIAHSHEESFIFSKGTSVFLIGDSLSLKDSGILAQNFRHVHLVKDSSEEYPDFIEWDGVKILVLGDEYQEGQISLTHPDILILRSVLNSNSTAAFENLNHTKIFISSSIPWYTAKKIENDLRERQLPFHNLKTNGGVIWNY